MANKRDYYEVLGLQRDASEKEIASAYRKLAVKYHPDTNPGDDDASAKFKEAAEAYEVLGDQQKRGRYDQFGHAGVDGAGSQFGSAEDIFEAFGDLFGGGGIFGDFFGGGRQQRRARKGGDVRVDVTLPLEEAASGVDKDLEFDRHKKCATCSGKGSKPGTNPQMCGRCAGHGQVLQSAGILRVQTTCNACGGRGTIITDPCNDCRGAGLVRDSVSINVHIPAGVDDGMRVRLAGEGEPAPEGGVPGDVYCFIRVKRHKIFHRDGRNLVLQMPITFTQATLGAEIEVPTLNGPHEMKIPAGTQSGEVFKIRGQGMPDAQSGRVGDLMVQTYIETPKKLTPRQEELLRELAELEQTNVSPQRESFFEKVKGYFSPSSES